MVALVLTRLYAQDAKQHMADTGAQAEQELADQKTTYEKTKQVIAADKVAAENMAASETAHTIKQAQEKQKATLEQSAQEKQKQMAAIALSPVEQAADGAIEAGPIELIQVGDS